VRSAVPRPVTSRSTFLHHSPQSAGADAKKSASPPSGKIGTSEVFPPPPAFPDRPHCPRLCSLRCAVEEAKYVHHFHDRSIHSPHRTAHAVVLAHPQLSNGACAAGARHFPRFFGGAVGRGLVLGTRSAIRRTGFHGRMTCG